MSWVAAIIFYNITSVGEIESSINGLRGSVFRTLKELEFAAMGLSSSRRRKNEERLKQFVENLSEMSSQKSEESCSG
jgi:hypothetical protein